MATGRLLLVVLVPACRLGFDPRPAVDACPVISCTGDQIVDCTGTHTCALGCAPGDPPHCLRLAPSNGVTVELLAGVTADLAGGSLRFATDTGEITDDGGAIVRAAGTGVDAGIGYYPVDQLGVFVAVDMSVPPGATWTATGGRGLVLYAADTIAIDGAVDAGAIDTAGGPGGTAGSVGAPRPACEGQDGRYKTSIGAGAGGGGGGGRSAGGGGAPTVADAMGATSGGAGGTACAPPATIPLRGGNGAGAGGTENLIVRGGAGGGGGGAVALIAMTRVTIAGVVAVSGAGGATIAGGSGGSGGGGGGAVLIESIDVAVSGAITANGGGGGPAVNGSAAQIRGERGHVADGGTAIGGASAGNGGTGTTAPTDGATATGGGGGGGAAGAVEIKAITADVTNATTSPAAVSSQAKLE